MSEETLYALQLAEALDEAGETDGVTLGPTDAALAAKALRALAATIRDETAQQDG